MLDGSAPVSTEKCEGMVHGAGAHAFSNVIAEAPNLTRLDMRRASSYRMVSRKISTTFGRCDSPTRTGTAVETPARLLMPAPTARTMVPQRISTIAGDLKTNALGQGSRKPAISKKARTMRQAPIAAAVEMFAPCFSAGPPRLMRSTPGPAARSALKASLLRGGIRQTKPTARQNEIQINGTQNHSHGVR